MEKPFSHACENNKDPILQVIGKVFEQSTMVLEIGSGTGQHACYFARHLPHVIWQPSDKKENLAGIDQWVEAAQLANLNNPLELDVCFDTWSVKEISALFTANTLHIMSWSEVETFFDQLNLYLADEAIICIYGPFNYHHQYSSDSNARFDQWLKARDPLSGIRDFESVQSLAKAAEIKLIQDVAMPANNRLLVWKKTPF